MKNHLPSLFPLYFGPAAVAAFAAHDRHRRNIRIASTHLRAHHAARIAARPEEQDINDALDQLADLWEIDL